MKNKSEVTRLRLEPQDLKDARKLAKETGMKLCEVLGKATRVGLKTFRQKKAIPL